jgi:hypothetical protein
MPIIKRSCTASVAPEIFIGAADMILIADKSCQQRNYVMPVSVQAKSVPMIRYGRF